MAQELSHAWSTKEPPTAQASLAELEHLRGQCSPTQLRHRQEAFPKAQRYIEGVAGTGVEAPVYKNFHDWPKPKAAKDARVDIEVVYGRAFA